MGAYASVVEFYDSNFVRISSVGSFTNTTFVPYNGSSGPISPSTTPSSYILQCAGVPDPTTSNLPKTFSVMDAGTPSRMQSVNVIIPTTFTTQYGYCLFFVLNYKTTAITLNIPDQNNVFTAYTVPAKGSLGVSSTMPNQTIVPTVRFNSYTVAPPTFAATGTAIAATRNTTYVSPDSTITTGTIPRSATDSSRYHIDQVISGTSPVFGQTLTATYNITTNALDLTSKIVPINSAVSYTWNVASRPLLQGVYTGYYFAFAQNLSPDVCVRADTLVETDKGPIEICKLKTGDKIKRMDGEFIELLGNAQLKPPKSYIRIPKHFDGDQPSQDLHITDGHPVWLNGTEVKAFDLLGLDEGDNKQQVTQITNAEGASSYTLVTHDRVFVWMNGIPVCTWAKADFGAAMEKLKLDPILH
jgi:hypothetical protein